MRVGKGYTKANNKVYYNYEMKVEVRFSILNQQKELEEEATQKMS